MKAEWIDVTLAESKETIVVEGNHYFPPGSLNRHYFRKATCPWKGEDGLLS